MCYTHIATAYPNYLCYTDENSTRRRNDFIAAAEPIRRKADIKRLARYYLDRGQTRNYLLVVAGVCTALRIGDLLALRWDDVYDEKSNKYRSHVQLREQKTGKTKTLALNNSVLLALQQYADSLGGPQPGRYLFEGPRPGYAPITRVQAYRIIRDAADAVGLEGHITCHSLRKTFGYHAWKIGTPPVLIMDIYNHSSYDTTRRYLGLCQDERDTVYRSLHLL